MTGSATGIGWACAQAIASRGDAVLAGVLDEAQVREVEERGVDGITPFVLDVTDPDHVAGAARRVETFEREVGPLRGVVNNAGLAVAGPLEILHDEHLRQQLDVNVLGLMAVTRAMLPALRRSRGRIVNIGSVGGRLAVPFTGPYAASKFAVRALSDALRVELRPAGVTVVLIEPGPIATPIWRRSMEAASRRLEELDPQQRALYEREIEVVFGTTRKTEAGAIPVERVSRAVTRALFDRRPRAQVLVGAQAYLQAAVSLLPARVRDGLLMRGLGLTPSA